MLDVKDIRKDFPMYSLHNGEYDNKPLHYLDNAATSFKPSVVINKINEYYNNYSANTKRSDYSLAYKIDQEFEEARKVVASFINANIDEVAFTSGATMSLNEIAYSLLYELKEGDEIILSYNEHASNVLPWYNIAKMKRCKIVFAPSDKKGVITPNNLSKVMTPKTKIVSLASVTNVLGVRQPIKELVKITHNNNALFVCDGAQEAPHHKIDVKDTNVDFLALSSHKMVGPTGVGLLYVKKEVQNKIWPFIYGGEMNSRFDSSLNVSLKEFPLSFEAGTQNIAGILGFAEACKYLNNIGLEEIEKHEKSLKTYAIKQLKEMKNIILYNDFNDSGIITFNVKDIHAQDVATFLSSNNVFIRSGNHCAKLLPEVLNVNSTCRASLYLYNDFSDIDALVSSLKKSGDFLDVYF